MKILEKVKTIFIFCVISLSACEKQAEETVTPPAEKASSKLESTAEVTNNQPSATQTKPEMTLTQAHAFAEKYLSKLNEQELYLMDAVKLNEIKTVDRIESDLLNIPEWPESVTLNPYTKCDTAWRDLFILAGAHSMSLKEQSATLMKIVRQETSDYQNSKSKCEARVNMTPEQAAQAEVTEYVNLPVK